MIVSAIKFNRSNSTSFSLIYISTYSYAGFTASEEMHITQEVVYTLPTDGVVFSTIVGTANGRIFMGAKDGCLYEFLYQVKSRSSLCLSTSVPHY